MSSILNSISSGDLQVQHVPREKPVKEDSILDLLQNSEIEFEIHKEPETIINNSIPVFEEIVNYEISNQEELPKKEDSIYDLLENIKIELTTCPHLIDKLEFINTGFGENQDLHYKNPCKLPELKLPLYKENYFSEFKTEEEKAAARHALGLYNKGDIVAMSLLTAENKLPSEVDWENTTIKQLRKGDEFFVPITSLSAIYTPDGINLETQFNEITSLINIHEEKINSIISISKDSEIKSLGDVQIFLQGFDKTKNLQTTLDEINQEMLKFEKTGQITINIK